MILAQLDADVVQPRNGLRQNRFAGGFENVTFAIRGLSRSRLIRCWVMPSSAPVKLFAATVLKSAALGSSRGEEACGLFGELFIKLEVRPVPGIRVEDQPGIR
jgi:hypothetical protein